MTCSHIRSDHAECFERLWVSLPHQRVWEQGDDYRSQICISNYQDPFAKGPMCAKSNSSCEALVIVCINLHAEPWTPKLYCGKTVGASQVTQSEL